MPHPRTPVTAPCPHCRAPNNVGLADLLARTGLTILCRRCQSAFSIPLRPGIAAARAPEPTTPLPQTRGCPAAAPPPTSGWFRRVVLALTRER